MKNAFTLIELLIVVAIIGILAAIAIPYFLNAQIRAQVVRAKADLTALSTAIDMYRLDYNSYPIPAYFIHGHENSKSRDNYRPLTTPAAYLSGALYDPFQKGIDPTHGGTFPNRDGTYVYATFRTRFEGDAEDIYRIYSYFLVSYGPDKTGSGFGPDVIWNIYTPSNGLVSTGDLIYLGQEHNFNDEIGWQRLFEIYSHYLAQQ